MLKFLSYGKEVTKDNAEMSTRKIISINFELQQIILKIHHLIIKYLLMKSEHRDMIYAEFKGISAVFLDKKQSRIRLTRKAIDSISSVLLQPSRRHVTVIRDTSKKSNRNNIFFCF